MTSFTQKNTQAVPAPSVSSQPSAKRTRSNTQEATTTVVLPATVSLDVTKDPPEEELDFTKPTSKTITNPTPPAKAPKATKHKRKPEEIWRYLKAYKKNGEGGAEGIVADLHILHMFEDWPKGKEGEVRALQYIRDLKVKDKSPLLKKDEYTNARAPNLNKGESEEEYRTRLSVHVANETKNKKYWSKARVLLEEIIAEDKKARSNMSPEDLMKSIEKDDAKRKGQKKEALGRLINAHSTDMASREKLTASINKICSIFEKSAKRYDRAMNLLEEFYKKLEINIPPPEEEEKEQTETPSSQTTTTSTTPQKSTTAK